MKNTNQAKRNKMKEWWINRSYWQRGAIIGFIYGLLPIFMLFTPLSWFSLWFFQTEILNVIFFTVIGLFIGSSIKKIKKIKEKERIRKCALVGGMLSIILFSILVFVEFGVCTPKLVEDQIVDGVPMCERLSEKRLIERHEFCKDGRLYSLERKESCIIKKLFFLSYEDFSSCGGIAPILIYLFIYGAIIGGFIAHVVNTENVYRQK